MSAHPYNTQAFAFLALPPPPLAHKKRSAAVPPDAPLPPTPPHKFAAIRAWAATVTPGSPAPRSPHRRPSISSTTSRRPSLISRRPSLALNLNVNAAQTLQDTAPTPATADATTGANNFDLTALGYTSVFVHLPNTPTTPSPLLREYDLKHRQPLVPKPTDTTAKRSGGPMRRFRSLSILRPSRGTKQSKKPTDAAPPSSPLKNTTNTQQQHLPSPPTPHTAGPTSPSTAYSKAEICAAKIAKRKRAKYAYVRPPPTLAHEIALMQFADGGSVESHVKRVMETQAKLAAGSRAGRTGTTTTINGGNGGAGGVGGGVIGGIADVYRDANGGIWWDADEEMEYAHLLEGDTTQDNSAGAAEMDWEESFVSEPLGAFLSPAPVPASTSTPTSTSTRIPPPADTNMDAEPNADAPRRASLSSIASSLDLTYLLPLPENENPSLQPLDDRALASRRIGGEGMSFLRLPSRPRREAVYLKHYSMRTKGEWPGENENGGAGGAGEDDRVAPVARPRGKARRRPAPLKLAVTGTGTSHSTAVVSPAPLRQRSQSHSQTMITANNVQGAKIEFLASSFEPTTAMLPEVNTMGDGETEIHTPDLGQQVQLQRTNTTVGKRVRGLFVKARRT